MEANTGGGDWINLAGPPATLQFRQGPKARDIAAWGKPAPKDYSAPKARIRQRPRRRPRHGARQRPEGLKARDRMIPPR